MRTKCEVAQELIFGIQESVPTVFSQTNNRRMRRHSQDIASHWKATKRFAHHTLTEITIYKPCCGRETSPTQTIVSTRFTRRLHAVYQFLPASSSRQPSSVELHTLKERHSWPSGLCHRLLCPPAAVEDSAAPRVDRHGVPNRSSKRSSLQRAAGGCLLTVLCLVTSSLQPQKCSTLISDLPNQMFSDRAQLISVGLSPCDLAQIGVSLATG